MPKNFDEMLAEDRSFEVRGEKFEYIDVRPEVLSAFQPEEEEEGKEPDANAIWRSIDDQIVLFLDEENSKRWRELRSRDDKPVTVTQLNAVLTWLVEEQTDRPSPTPSPSDSGGGRTARTSKA